MKITMAQRRALIGLRDTGNISTHFRDAAAWRALTGQVIPALLRKGLVEYHLGDYSLTTVGRELLTEEARP